MEIISREGSSGMDRAEVLQLMEATYYLQCKVINARPAPALGDVKKQWPYLFFPRTMRAHFELLTNIQMVRKTEVILKEHGKNLMEFFKHNPTNDGVKAVLPQDRLQCQCFKHPSGFDGILQGATGCPHHRNWCELVFVTLSVFNDSISFVQHVPLSLH